MNRKIFATVIVLMAFPFLSMAQNRNGIKARPKQLFKLEDLIPGGSTYYLNSVPPSTRKPTMARRSSRSATSTRHWATKAHCATSTA